MQTGCLCSSLQSGSGGERIAFVRDGRDDAAVTGKLRIWSGFWLFRMAEKAMPVYQY